MSETSSNGGGSCDSESNHRKGSPTNYFVPGQRRFPPPPSGLSKSDSNSASRGDSESNRRTMSPAPSFVPGQRRFPVPPSGLCRSDTNSPYDSDTDINSPIHRGDSPTQHPNFIPGQRRFPPQPSVLSKSNNSSPYPDVRNNSRRGKKERHEYAYSSASTSVPNGKYISAPSGLISETSSAISVSSSSTDGTSDHGFNSVVPPGYKYNPPQPPINHVLKPGPEPWELVPNVSLEGATSESPPCESAMGGVLRKMLTVDTSVNKAQPPPPPPPEMFLLNGNGVDLGNPLSPKSMKNRPELDVECPNSIRRRSRSDSLAYEVHLNKIFKLHYYTMSYSNV